MSAALITVPRSFGGTLLLTPPPLSITIGGNAVVFDEDTFQLSLKLDERWRFQFTVLDYAGTQQFSYRQQVVVTDANLGILFAGFVADVKQDKTNMYPSPGIEHQIDCIDMRGLVDKKTSNWFYANQQAGVIAVHQVQKYLAAEGITAAAALRWDEQLTDWQQGTLTNTVATSNAFDSNVGDGDLELAAAGTKVTVLENTTAEFATGILSNVTAASNSLAPTTTSAIKLVAKCTQPGSVNAYTYMKVWAGSHAIGTNEIMSYDIWIDPSSPSGQMGVDVIFTDGTTWRDTATTPDAQFVLPHPKNDVGPMAIGRWYHRNFDWSAYSGKTVQSVQIVSEGDAVGTYTCWVKSIKTSGGVFNYTLNTTQQIGNNGYSSAAISVVNTYDLTSATPFRTSAAYSISAAQLLQSSFVTWSALEPAGTKFVLQYSLDNVIFQPCTKDAPLPNLPAGTKVAGKSIYVQEQFTIDSTATTKASPEVAPVLSALQVTINPSYNATKSDVLYSIGANADWVAGAFTSTTNNAGRDLSLIGATRTWDDGTDMTDQTPWSASATFSPDRQTFHISVPAAVGAVSAEARSRMDFAGTIADGIIEVDILLDNATVKSGVIYRTTFWSNADLTWAYAVEVTQTNIKLFHCTNSAVTTLTQIGPTATLAITSGNWHRLKVSFIGSAHKVWLDDVLYINQVDATFLAAGNVALRISNPNTAAGYTGFFDNFGVMAALTGTWISANQSLAGAGTYGNSVASWRDMSFDPGNTDTILVETQVDGVNWLTATNGSPIPGLTVGQNLATVNLKVRITLTTTTASTMPSIDNLIFLVLGSFSASGTRISPSLSLAPVGSQVGTALVNWNANLPTNTGLTVQTSINGGSTYQTISAPGNAIPNITTQPAPLEDSFESNQANYLSTFGNGGAVGTWALDTANSRIIASGGSDALYLRSDNRYAGLTIGVNPGIGNAGSPYPFWNLLLPDMIAKGLFTLRFQISWRNIELVQGVYTWTVLDDAVSHCNAAGIRILYTIRDAPTWAKDPANGAVLATTEPYYVMSASLAAGFAAQVATRYDGNHGHGVIDVFGFNEDFSIHFTPNGDTFTLNGTVTSGVAITSFPITASTVTPKAGTKIYFGTFSSPDVATVSTDVNVGDTTVHVSSFTPGSTYTATQVLKIGYVGTYNNPNYPGLYGAGDAVTTINKTQPTRDFHFAAAVYTAVYNAIRAVNPTVPIGLPVVWWIQPANPGGTPNTPVSNHTASLQTLYTAGVPMDAGTFVDFHYYSNGIDPTVGNNQTNTIGQVMIDFAAVATANGDAGRQIICTEFGWQADQSTTSSTTIAAGTRTITLASTNGAAIGGTCLIDTVGSGVQETVTITGKASTTITAVFANAHTATYPVVISQDCAPTGIDGQDERYTEVMSAIQGASPSNQFFFYTLDYSTSGPQTSSLVFWNGSSYVYQPAWTSIATYLAAHPGGSSTNTSADVDILVDMDQSDAGGMAWRYINASNFYELAVRDALSPTNPNTVQLFKMVAGVRSAIGPTNPAIRFVRGIPYRVRVTMIGGVITVFFDGVQVATYTDGSPLSAGLCGLRNDTVSGASASRYYQLRIQPLGQNVSALSLLTKVTLTSTDPTVTPQLLDMQAFVSSPAIGAGTLIPSASYKRTFVDKNLDDLAKQSNYGWFVDQFKALNFQGRQAVPAPWVLSSNTLAQPSDLEVDSNLLVEIAGDLYRNRQVLTGVIGTAVFSDSFIGDGKATSFTLRYPIAPGTIPTITLDGQAQTVALQGATGANWYYAVGSTTIAQDSSGTVLTDLDTLVVAPYTGTFTTEVVVNNLSAQTALALVEGGSGIVEAVEDVSSRNMTLAAATTYANQLLARYCITGRTLTYKTYRNGLAVGQIQSVIVPEEFLQDVQLLIRQIDIGMQTQPNKTVLYNYLVNATELPNVGSWQKLIASGLLD